MGYFRSKAIFFEFLKDFILMRIYRNIPLKEPKQESSFMPTIGWHEYVSKLNARTSMKTPLNMVHKIKGKGSGASAKQIEKKGKNTIKGYRQYH